MMEYIQEHYIDYGTCHVKTWSNERMVKVYNGYVLGSRAKLETYVCDTQ